jgi:hypothetical protein
VFPSSGGRWSWTIGVAENSIGLATIVTLSRGGWRRHPHAAVEHLRIANPRQVADGPQGTPAGSSSESHSRAGRKRMRSAEADQQVAIAHALRVGRETGRAHRHAGDFAELGELAVVADRDDQNSSAALKT